jgi:hypothetical protein
MGERVALETAFELFFADRFPELVNRFDRVERHLVDRELEVFCPQLSAGTGGEVLVMGYDVHLRVVEERVLIEVG